MKETLIISFLIIFIYIFLILNKNNLVLIESQGKKALVYNSKSKDVREKSASLLNQLTNNMYKVRDHLKSNLSTCIEKYSTNQFTENDIRESIEMLNTNLNVNKTKIYENAPSSEYTSYSVNKGEELAFCLISKESGIHHELNLIMYVALHEMAHIGCREIGHTQLFKDIFQMYTREAMDMDPPVYVYKNYDSNPVEYCGMTLSSTIV